MRQLRHLAYPILCAALVSACAKSDKGTASDTSTATVAAAPANSTATATAPAAPITPAALAGNWNIRTVGPTGDTTRSVLHATNSTSGWTRTFPGKAPVPIRVTTAGDSVVMDMGPYSSARKSGVKVVTHTVMRLQGDTLRGVTVAHYEVKAADSVTNLPTMGTRAH